MSDVQFPRGALLEREDLSINLVDDQGRPVDAHEITFAIYDATTDVEVLVGPSERIPAHPEIGEYYAPIQIPRNANIGSYRLRWNFRRAAGDDQVTVLQEFEVVRPETFRQQQYSDVLLDMIRRLRNRLRDNDPDKHYHFRPPTSEGYINDQNAVFSYIWEDDELVEYMEGALDYVNLWPPETHFDSIEKMLKTKPAWRQMILMGAIVHACFALSANWVADEFDYSIGGVSLSIEKSSKYQSLKDNAEAQFEKMLEAKERTVKIIRGLRQSRYGIGVRSAFGPHTGAGTLTPRKFLGF